MSRDELIALAEQLQVVADVRRDQTSAQHPDSAQWIAMRAATLTLDSLAAALATSLRAKAGDTH